MKLHKISERVYANWDGETGGNVGIIIGDVAVYAVDSQFPAPARDFRANIPSVTDKPVTHLILTHMHSDHVLGSQAFEDCEIISHRKVKEKMEKKLQEEWSPAKLETTLEDIKKSRPEMAPLFEGLRIVLPTKVFEHEYEDDNVKVINTGGHTDCSSIVYVKEDTTLFIGDLLVPGMFPYAGDPSSDPIAWITAFKTIIDLQPKTVIPGHGKICDIEEVKNQLTYFEATKEIMTGLILDGVTLNAAIEHEGYPHLYNSTCGEEELYLKALYRVLKRCNY